VVFSKMSGTNGGFGKVNYQSGAYFIIIGLIAAVVFTIMSFINKE